MTCNCAYIILADTNAGDWLLQSKNKMPKLFTAVHILLLTVHFVFFLGAAFVMWNIKTRFILVINQLDEQNLFLQ